MAEAAEGVGLGQPPAYYVELAHAYWSRFAGRTAWIQLGSSSHRQESNENVRQHGRNARFVPSMSRPPETSSSSEVVRRLRPLWSVSRPPTSYGRQAWV